MEDPYKYFRIEAAELVEHLSRGVLALERGTKTADTIGELLRQAHTLKGAARVVRQPEIADATHAIETVLAQHRDATTPLSSQHISEILRQLDDIQARVAALPNPRGESPKPKDSPATSSAAPLLRAELREVNRVIDGLSELLIELSTIKHSSERLQATRVHGIDHLLRQLNAPHDPQLADSAPTLTHLRTDLEELDDSLRRIEHAVHTSLDRAHRELDDLRAAAERLKLVPVTASLTFLERAVRDVAQELDKAVDFQTTGDALRLDGHVLETVQNALLHVVRNAVVHGIETKAEREQTKKPPRGIVRIDLERRDDTIVFACEDDGKGVDIVELRRRAGPDKANGKSDEELLHVLLESGTSTSTHISKIAGRGVGLDVAAAAAERLGGAVRLHSRPGQGFRLELEVPMFFSALPCLAAEVTGNLVFLPLDRVRCALGEQSLAIVPGDRSDGLRLDDRWIPWVRLDELLTKERQGKSPPRSAVVLRGKHGEVAVGVDRVRGSRSVVLQRLPGLVPRQPLVTGAVLDGAGNPVLVLSPSGLEAQATQPRRISSPSAPLVHRLLVVDDSLTTRMLEQSILESAGYSVDLACSGEEGLEKVRSTSYAACLVDVEMPGINGFEFVQAVRADPTLEPLPIILVTSRSAATDMTRAQAVGANGYMVKDRFDQRELLQMIGNLAEAR